MLGYRGTDTGSHYIGICILISVIDSVSVYISVTVTISLLVIFADKALQADSILFEETFRAIKVK
ncbi:MAG: hypothetical protein WBZ29_02265 [Methanocella sp.]